MPLTPFDTPSQKNISIDGGNVTVYPMGPNTTEPMSFGPGSLEDILWKKMMDQIKNHPPRNVNASVYASVQVHENSTTHTTTVEDPPKDQL